jgi:hypothetical protein
MELQELSIHELEAPIITELLEKLQIIEPVDPSIADSYDCPIQDR